MTEALVEKTCIPCRGGIPPLTRAEAEELLPQAPEWAFMDNAHRIEKTFRFSNFGEALAFVQKVGEFAEAESHHPYISFGWGYGTVSLRTKKIKGLHENDHHGGKDRSACANRAGFENLNSRLSGFSA